MKLYDDNDIIRLIKEDQWMMNILEAASRLDLPDWWICAGFVRSKIWDHLHGFHERTPMADIDVVYFDDDNLDKSNEKRYESLLHQLLPGIPWSVKNEARMHLVNDIEPYRNTEDAIAKFPETATALGVRMNPDGTLTLTAPHGVEDVMNMIICPTPYFMESAALLDIFYHRINTKNWCAKWNLVKIDDCLIKSCES